MRLRTFTARTMPEAMALVRQHLGVDAIILSTGSEGGAISVTAALEHAGAPAEAASASGMSAATAPVPEDTVDMLHESLAAHGVPARLVDTLINTAAELPARNPALV